MSIDDKLIRLYRSIFARRMFYRLNALLFQCSLRGLGVLNYETNALSGESRFLAHWLRRSGNSGTCIVLDVGANVGKYSQEVLGVNPSATVHGFEPHPVTFEKLRANIQDANFHPHLCAVGDEKGELTLYDYAERDGSSHASLYKGVIEGIHKAKSVEHKVAVITLGDFLANHKIDEVALLKIDTEGHELNVLRGVVGHLKASKIHANQPLFCELFAYQNIVAILKLKIEGRHARGYY